MMRLTTLKWVPPFAQGYVKDLVVRWALDEIGAEYSVCLIASSELDVDEYRKLQPFGQVPVFEDAGLALFESGSILLHVGEKSEILLPLEPHARERARSWVFAALNSIEPYVRNFNEVIDDDSSQATAERRRVQARDLLNRRLLALDRWLEGRDYLEGHFSIGDIMMSYALRHLVDSGVLKEFKNLRSYHERCEARPAFKKALAAQLRAFAENDPSK